MKRDAVYLSGPMTGLPHHNYPAFDAAAKRLRGMGFKVVNPAEQPEQPTWSDYMREDIGQMVKYCHALIYLPGWQDSKGATTEVYLARRLGMPCIAFDDELNLFRLRHQPESITRHGLLELVNLEETTHV